MSHSHTPGPWILDGRTVYALQHSGWKHGVEQMENRFSAGVQGAANCPHEELIANARLMSAAPDLLSAAKAVLHQLENGEASDGDRRDIAWCAEQLAAAVAKAEGR